MNAEVYAVSSEVNKVDLTALEDVDRLIAELETQFEDSELLPMTPMAVGTQGCTGAAGCTGSCPCGGADE